MASIQKGRDLLTLVNVFTVKQDDQDKLVALLVEATEKTMKQRGRRLDQLIRAGGAS